jgi:kynurenine formamidase
MRVRSFIIAYALVLALLLFADRRPTAPQNRYSQVVDLTEGSAAAGSPQTSGTRIISPAALIPGTWGAAQIPAERLIAPLAVMDLTSDAQLSVEDIANWETRHGNVPQGAIVALRNKPDSQTRFAGQFPIAADAAQFLMEARYTLGFVVETPAGLDRDRALARQLALHGNYVVEDSGRMTALPETGSLIIVAPTKTTSAPTTPVRVLAMVR